MGSVLGAFFYFLLKENEQILGRLRKEVDEAGLERVISYADAQQLPYLQAVVRVPSLPPRPHRG